MELVESSMNIDEDRVSLYLEMMISGTTHYCRCPAGMEVGFWGEGWIEVNGHSLKAPYSKSLFKEVDIPLFSTVIYSSREDFVLLAGGDADSVVSEGKAVREWLGWWVVVPTSPDLQTTCDPHLVHSLRLPQPRCIHSLHPSCVPNVVFIWGGPIVHGDARIWSPRFHEMHG